MISNQDDQIDSRQVIARIEELESLLSIDDDEDDETEDMDTDPLGEVDLYEEEREELGVLRALAEEASASPDWTYGETLIRRSYFVEYAEQLAEDCGEIPESMDTWPLRYMSIDWEAAADALECDYISVDYGNVEYLIRA